VPERFSVVSSDAVVMLVGPSGAGKSTLARKHFRATGIISTDALRALLTNSPVNLTATPMALRLLYEVLDYRCHILLRGEQALPALL
jgi:protein phosphatase